MITGNRTLSPTNAEDVNYLGKSENANGEKVKVVIITDAGSEGLDFKNIRQVHILDPWYNMNKIEQIIGRAVRNYSHCGLKFEERNVEIYMHAVLFGEKETADLYMYRLAEKKAMRAGKITRIMKESAVDCLINKSQRNFTQSVIETSEDVPNEGKIQIHIASIPETERIEYAVGDREFSHMCDYMACDYQCVPTDTLVKTPGVPTQYTTDFLTQKQNNIMRRIRDAFRERSVYHRNMLFQYVNAQNKYTMQQFLFALTTFIQNQNEVLVNGVGHKGYLVNRGEYYAFQPAEITDESISQFDRDAVIQVENGAE
jgi:superfamily II DNA/RNA helicase